jgi:glucosamine-6-phosphate deaminase
MTMDICTSPTKSELGKRAADAGAELIRAAIEQHGKATVIVATGASQFEMLASLVSAPGIDWSRITGFHLDEYVGMPITHPASFCRYLKERFVDKVPIAKFHYISGEGLDGTGDVQAECARLARLIRQEAVDVAFVGIGENGHLAFNDPPADFDTDDPYLVVQLDEACRRQQLGEGWFPTLDDVPRQAISMSVRQIMKSQHIICSVPDARKADAVKWTVEGPVTPMAPASILQEHGDIRLYLDGPAASLLTKATSR